MDPVIDLQDGHKGVGVLVRDSSGSLVGVVTMRVPNMVLVLATELYAIKVGLSFVLDASLVMLIVESDFLQAVEFVNSYEDCFALEGMFVDEIHRIL